MNEKRSRHIYRVGVYAQSLTHEKVKATFPGDMPVAYQRDVLATSRDEAVAKCEADIRKLPHDPTIKRISVACGRPNVPAEYPGRMWPITIHL